MKESAKEVSAPAKNQDVSLWQKLKHKISEKFHAKPPFDPVDEASEESFPASDPPAYPRPRH